MQVSTYKLLSVAIALPLFITNLNFANPVNAEQIDRTRSSQKEVIPSFTDLNLTIPTVTNLEDGNRQRANFGSSIRRANSSRRNVSKLSLREPNITKPKSIARSQPAVIVQPKANILAIGNRSHRVKSIANRKNLGTINIEAPTLVLNQNSFRTGSNSRQKIATILPRLSSENYLRLVRDPDKGANALGNPIYTLEAYIDGELYRSFDAVSGIRSSQQADRNLGKNHAPLPDGTYSVSDRIVPGATPEVGRTFVAIYPKFATNRSDLGIHLDPSFNKQNGYDGTSGCIGLTTPADRDAINEFVTKYQPRNLFVKIVAREDRE